MPGRVRTLSISASLENSSPKFSGLNTAHAGSLLTNASIFGSRGQYKLESISEDAIYLDGVIPLFRDKAWEEKLLKSGRKVTHDTNVFSSPRKSKGSWTRGCSLPMPGSLPEFPVQFPVGR